MLVIEELAQSHPRNLETQCRFRNPYLRMQMKPIELKLLYKPQQSHLRTPRASWPRMR